ncbi:MAG: TadE/TadG family type IV pilus assembly protein, partial [Vicinamibacterales bacterium]
MADHRLPRHRRPDPASERGDATVEAVLAVPVLLLLIMTVIQFGLYFHAQHTVTAA